MYISHTSTGGSDESGDDPGERMAAMFGPGHVDQMLRSGVQQCWMLLPKERRNLAELEKQVRRIVDRALANFAEAVKQFGRNGWIAHS